MTEAEFGPFRAQLEAIDVTVVNEIFEATMAAQRRGGPASTGALEPAEGVTKLSDASEAEQARWRSLALRGIVDHKLAALVLAGGQGTRLGFDRPKGEYDIGLPSHKTLFQLQIERIQRLRALAAAEFGRSPLDIHLPLYVMTSPMTDADTRAFFEAHANFGLPDEDVFFFVQGTLPCLDFDGKILLEHAHRVAEAPDGNGGIYRALHLQGVVADLRRRGVELVHVFAVDNAVVKSADPVFLGYCLEKEADVGSKVVPKIGPDEKVGVLCRRGGRYEVVEYSDMDAATKSARHPSTGELLFSAGNICIHAYSRAFLEGPASPARLPREYHIARKKIPHADPTTGRTVAATAENGIKLESFIFDVFPSAERMAVLEVDRAGEFSPVKNAPGSASDSPDTARLIASERARRWLRAAGVTIVDRHDASSSSSSASSGGASSGGASSGGAAAGGVAPFLVEVSPLVSYDGENLALLSGATLVAPCLLSLAPEGFGASDSKDAESIVVESGVTLRHTHREDGVNVYEIVG